MHPTLTYSLVIMICVGLSLFSKKHDILACITIAVILTVSAGFRSYGFDFQEYLIIINSIFASEVDDIESLIDVAKDPFFSSFVLFGRAFTNDPYDILAAIAFLSVFPKLLLALSLPSYRALFLSVYAIFLAPGLEFAAVRAGIAIGFCGLLLIGRMGWWRRVIVSLLAPLSHVSAILAIGGFWLFKPRRLDILVVALLTSMVATYMAFVVFDFFSVVDVVAGSNRSDDYLHDKGTVNNFFFPASTLLILALAAFWMFDRHSKREIDLLPQELLVAALLCATAMGAAVPVSTFVIRILEFVWFFYIFGMMSLFSKEQSGFWRSGFVFWIALITYVNIHRETWDAMGPALFVGWN